MKVSKFFRVALYTAYVLVFAVGVPAAAFALWWLLGCDPQPAMQCIGLSP